MPIPTASRVPRRLRLGAGAALRRAAGWFRPAACVLVYHRIGEPTVNPFGSTISAATFESHLRVLAQAYEVRTLDDISDALERRSGLEHGTVAVTFDDGYVDNLTSAVPIAAKFDVPLHVFVYVDPVRSGESFWWDDLSRAVLLGGDAEGPSTVVVAGTPYDVGTSRSRWETYRLLRRRLKHVTAKPRAALLDELCQQLVPNLDADLGRPLDVGELQQLAGSHGVGVGAHSLSHTCLATLDDEAQLRELADARNILEELIGRPVVHAAYPFGKGDDITRGTRSIAAKAGYRAAFMTVPSPLTLRSDPYSLPRLPVHDWPEATFRMNLRAILGC